LLADLDGHLGISEHSRWLSQEHSSRSMDLANYHGNFLVDSLAIFPAPKGEWPLSSWRSGRPKMGTSDELGVLFSVFCDCGIRILLGKKRNPSKVVPT
jgi:hypothetical protein